MALVSRKVHLSPHPTVSTRKEPGAPVEKETGLQSFWAWWGWGGQSQPGVTTDCPCPCSQGLAPTAHAKCFESFPLVKRNKNHIQGTRRLGVRPSEKCSAPDEGETRRPNTNSWCCRHALTSSLWAPLVWPPPSPVQPPLLGLHGIAREAPRPGSGTDPHWLP